MSFDTVKETVSNYIYNNPGLDITREDITTAFGLEGQQATYILNDLIKEGAIQEKNGYYKPKEEKMPAEPVGAESSDNSAPTAGANLDKPKEEPKEEKPAEKKGTKVTDEEKREILELYTKENLTLKQIGKAVGRSQGAVYNVVKYSERGKEKKIGRPEVELDIDKITEMHKTMSVESIAKKLGVHRNSIFRRLKKEGLIEDHPQKEPYKKKSLAKGGTDFNMPLLSPPLPKAGTTMVKVRWVDALRLELGVIQNCELPDLKPVVAEIVGFLVHEDEERIVLSQERWEELGGSKYVHVIPRRSVLEVTELRERGGK